MGCDIYRYHTEVMDKIQSGVQGPTAPVGGMKGGSAPIRFHTANKPGIRNVYA